jgi:quercetin dioxygenase-like cupin family protein
MEEAERVASSNNSDSPEHLDAMIAAPEHHELLLENDVVRVLDSLLRPGESTPVHTHRWPSAQYVIGLSDFVRRDGEGNVLLDTRENGSLPAAGTAFWSQPLQPHSVTNVGNSDIRVISVEIKG